MFYKANVTGDVSHEYREGYRIGQSCYTRLFAVAGLQAVQIVPLSPQAVYLTGNEVTVVAQEATKLKVTSGC